MASYKVSHRTNGNNQTQTNGTNGNGANGQNGNGANGNGANGNRNPFGSRHVRIQQAADFLSVSPQTVRNMLQDPDCPLRSFSTLGGHRRVETRSLLEYEGLDCETEEKSDGGGKLIVVCRVSSPKQAAENEDGISSLDRQEQRLREFCQERFSRQPDIVLRRQASGLNYAHPVLEQFLLDLATGTYHDCTIVCQDKSRMLRMGERLVQTIAKIHNNEIVYQYETEDCSEEGLSEQILDCLNFFVAVNNGRKNKRIAEIILDSDSLKRAYFLKLEGYSFKSIADILKSENRQDEKGRGYAWHIVRKNLMRCWDELGKLYGDNRESSFIVFSRTKTQRADDSMRVERKDVIKAYRAFCAENGYQPMSDNGIGEDCKKLGWRTTRSKTNTTVYRGLILNE